MTDDKNTVHTLYKKLLAFYPRGFREQLGESMEQTFSDRYNERKRQAKEGLFGFVLGMFVETAVGIVQEHIAVIMEMNTMKHIFANLRLPTIISFLIVLPFMLLDVMFVIVKRPNTFSLRNALDFVVLFGFLWLGLAAMILILMPFVRNIRARDDVIANAAHTQGKAIENIRPNPTSAAMISLMAFPSCRARSGAGCPTTLP